MRIYFFFIFGLLTLDTCFIFDFDSFDVDFIEPSIFVVAMRKQPSREDGIGLLLTCEHMNKHQEEDQTETSDVI